MSDRDRQDAEPRHVRTSPTRAEDGSAGLLGLQRAAGNRAVSDLVEQAPPGGPTVQRFLPSMGEMMKGIGSLFGGGRTAPPAPTSKGMPMPFPTPGGGAGAGGGTKSPGAMTPPGGTPTMGFPDVAKTPAGPAPFVPTPYPNIGGGAVGGGGGGVKSTPTPAAAKAGDEPGTLKGMVGGQGGEAGADKGGVTDMVGSVGDLIGGLFDGSD